MTLGVRCSVLIGRLFVITIEVEMLLAARIHTNKVHHVQNVMIVLGHRAVRRISV